MTAAAKPAAAHTPGRTVPYYACEHGIPGGCNWCRATVTTERDALRAEVERLREALQYIAELGGNQEDERYMTRTGPNDAVARGILYVGSRQAARAALGRGK